MTRGESQAAVPPLTLDGAIGGAAAGPVDRPAAVPAAPRGRWGVGSVNLIAGMLVPFGGALAWELLVRQGLASDALLPTPSTVLATLIDLARDGELWRHAWATLWRVGVGFFLGVLAGTVMGALTGYSSLARTLLDPTLQALRNIPSIAWVPLFILWFGIFELSKVTLIAVGVFFPVYLGLASAIRDVDRKLVEVGRAFRLTPLQLVRRVLLPAALPTYVISLRAGLGLGWMFVVAAEFMGASEGLGFLLVDGQMTGRPQVIVASIVVFAVLGKTTDAVLAGVAARFLRWQDAFKPR